MDYGLFNLTSATMQMTPVILGICHHRKTSLFCRQFTLRNEFRNSFPAKTFVCLLKCANLIPNLIPGMTNGASCTHTVCGYK